MNVISTENAPAAIGPYSQAFEVGNLVITSGQIPVDPATGVAPDGIEAQAHQSCKNVGAILEAAGVSFDKVVKTTCFLADMNDFQTFNSVYAVSYTHLDVYKRQHRARSGPRRADHPGGQAPGPLRRRT